MLSRLQTHAKTRTDTRTCGYTNTQIQIVRMFDQKGRDRGVKRDGKRIEQEKREIQMKRHRKRKFCIPFKQ